MKRQLKNTCYLLIDRYKNWRYTNNHKKELKKYLVATGIKLEKQKREQEFVNKWSPLHKLGKTTFGLYRFYAHFCGDNPDIITDDIFHMIVEPCLNNQTANSVYGDKNFYEQILPQEYFPICVLRNIESDYMDRDYHVIQMNNEEFDKHVLNNKDIQAKGKLIVKPTQDTAGGFGVRLFVFDGKQWKNSEGDILSLDFLEQKYKRNFILQETIEPSDFVRQFNSSSYCTFRIITYRSVVDDTLHLIGGYMRVGAKGSFKDNVHQGGYAIPISPDGKLSHQAINGQRKCYDYVNDINLKDNTFEVPNWQEIVNLCFDIARKVTPCRLLSFDIILNRENRPYIIEFNIKNQTMTTVQITSKPFFGEFTDEVITYCMIHKDNKRIYPLIIAKN